MYAAYTGAIAGAVTGVATTPLDVIKTRLMTQGSKRTYSGVFDCARKIGEQEGYATFLQVQYVSNHSVQCHLKRKDIKSAPLGFSQPDPLDGPGSL